MSTMLEPSGTWYSLVREDFAILLWEATKIGQPGAHPNHLNPSNTLPTTFDHHKLSYTAEKPTTLCLSSSATFLAFLP
jgi:hypothetical protein